MCLGCGGESLWEPSEHLWIFLGGKSFIFLVKLGIPPPRICEYVILNKHQGNTFIFQMILILPYVDIVSLHEGHAIQYNDKIRMVYDIFYHIHGT